MFLKFRSLELLGGTAGHVWGKVASSGQTVIETADNLAVLVARAQLSEIEKYTEAEKERQQEEAGRQETSEESEDDRLDLGRAHDFSSELLYSGNS